MVADIKKIVWRDEGIKKFYWRFEIFGMKGTDYEFLFSGNSFLSEGRFYRLDEGGGRPESNKVASSSHRRDSIIIWS